MEDYTVMKKGTEDVFYVLSMAMTHDDVVVLANVETGAIILSSLNDLSMNYEFNGRDDEESS